MKSRTSSLAVPTILLVFGLLPGFAAACPTYTVTNTNDSGSGSLRDAVSQAAGCAGSEINFNLPTGSTITLQSRILINSAMTIAGPGQSLLTISGGNNTRIFFVNPGAGSTVIINNLTLANGEALGGRSYYGGGAAGMGGAIFQYSGNLEISTTTFSDNTALGGYQFSNQAYGGGGFGGDASGGTGGSGGDLGGAPGSGGPGAGGNLDNNSANGGNGGFGGGGAGGSVGNGGNGGFGGGGGAASAVVPGYSPGSGGFGATGGYFFTPGSGAGFGGAIFAYAGNLNLTDVQFVNNAAVGSAGAQGKGGSVFVLSTANAASSFVTFTGSYAQQAGQSSQYPYGISGVYQDNLTCPGQDSVDVCGIVQTGAGDLTITQGYNQSGTTTRTLQQQFIVNNGTPGTEVTFTVIPSNGAGGTLGGAGFVTVTTDSYGNAVAPPFLANNTAGNFVVTASDSTGSVDFNVSTYACRANPSVSVAGDNGNDNIAGSLRETVDHACAGSTVTFQGGITGTITLLTRLRIDDNLAIQGPGAGNLTLSGGDGQRLFFIGNGNVAISNLTLANGVAQGWWSQAGGSGPGMGGAIFQNGGNLSVSGVTFAGNYAVGGAGIDSNTESEAGAGFGSFAAGYTPGGSGDLTYPDGLGGTSNGNLNGGFAAGGGYNPSGSGGNGGFGGGGGIGGNGSPSGQPGFGAGAVTTYYGGGGAGLGGAIFARNGTLSLSNDIFQNNTANIGAAGAQAKGGALFILSTATASGSNLTLTNNTAAQAGQNSIGVYGIGAYAGNLQCPGEDDADVCGILTDTSGKQTIEAVLVANNKTYDGTTTATIGSCTLLGVAPGDAGNVTCQNEQGRGGL